MIDRLVSENQQKQVSVEILTAEDLEHLKRETDSDIADIHAHPDPNDEMKYELRRKALYARLETGSRLEERER
jgi:hypothetical protein